MGVKELSLEIEKAAKNEVFAGGVLYVCKDGELVFKKSAGYATLEPEKRELCLDTIFDLASLTKPIVVATLAMMLVESGELELTCMVSDIVDCKNGMTATVADLLTHTSGLPSWRPFYRKITSKAGTLSAKSEIRNLVRQTEIVTKPGQKIRYSDLGFILLEEIIEKIADTKVDLMANEMIFDKIGMNDTFYCDKNISRRLPEKFASTTLSKFFTGFNLGVVSDDNCYAMGGVSGHAGLFSTGYDISLFVIEMLKALKNRSNLLSCRLAEMFTRQATLVGNRGLGWDKPTENSSSGDYFDNDHSFGHLGFSGTSIWVDPIKDIAVILLTNRVHPSTSNTKIRKFRPLIHNLVVEAFCSCQ